MTNLPLNAYDRQEHDDSVNAKNVSIKSSATIYAIVNTGAGSGNTTVEQGTTPWVSSLKGNVTIDSGVITLDDSEAYIGLATVDIGSAPTLTVDATGQGDLPITLDGEVVVTTFSGNVTLDDGSKIDTINTLTTLTNPVGIKGNVTITSGTITTITNPVALKGNVTLDDGSVINTINTVTTITNPVALKGNVTIDSVAGTVTVDATGSGDVPITLDSEVVEVDATGSGDVPITLDSEVVEVDATGQGDVPVTLDSEAVVLGAGVAYTGLATVDVGKAERYSSAYTSGPTINWAVKASAGFIHAIHVGNAVASSIIEVSNHASDGDGNVKLYQAEDTIGPAVYPLNMTMDTGICLDITNQEHVTVIYK